MTASPHEILMTVTVALASGSALIVLSRLLNQSSTVFLLAGGVLLGPEALGWVLPESLGDTLSVIVSLAVAIILFEGGLTLDLKGYRAAPVLIQRLLTVGVLTTWGGAWIAILAIFPFSPAFAALAASMVIVTGPTVITPLLRRIKVTPGVHHVLHWEGVLIDPIGVFLVLLTFEWIDGRSGDRVLGGFVARIVLGLVAGFASGLAFDQLLRRRILPEDLVNSFSLAFAVVVYGGCEALGHLFGFNESGLMAVIVAGFTIAVLDPPGLRKIQEFEATLTDLMIGLLFILLSARLELDDFRQFGAGGFLLVALIVFVLRPLNVFMSSVGLAVPWRERVFLSWIAPRGIVAASMASLLAMKLSAAGSVEEGRFLQTLVFSVIASTILLQGSTANGLARILGLKAPPPTGWIVVGAHAFAREIARLLRERGKPDVLLVDLNPRAVAEARNTGFPALEADARDLALMDRPEMVGMGRLLALTDNEHLNALLCERWAPILGETAVFGWASSPGGGRERDGHAIWTDLPRPSLLAAEMKSHRASLLARTREEPSVGVPILHAEPNGALRIGSSSKKESEAPAWRLELLRHEPRLVRALRSGDVLSLHAADLSDLLRRMLLDSKLSRTIGGSAESTLQALLEREEKFPTILGRGVALPHLHLPGIEAQVCVLGRVDPPLDYGDSGMPVRLVFLLVGPEGHAHEHLATMAEISLVASDESVVDALMQAARPEDAIDFIRGAVLRKDPPAPESGSL